MKKQIFFDTNNFTTYPCVGKAYLDFIDYAFEKTDYFMLVYINWYGKGYSKSMKHFRDALKKYKVKSRINPKWPGTPYSYSNGTTYKVIFYRVCEEAKAILKEVDGMNSWCGSNPEDLAFFKGNRCWFYSVGHEWIAGIIHADEEDIAFVESLGLARAESAIPEDAYYDLYDEILEGLL